MYLKRSKIEKFWAIPRKGTKYLAVPAHNQKESIPLLIIIRDILKLVKNKKELKKIINEKQIKINNKEIREVNYPISFFDIINLPKIKKNYRAEISKNRKMIFNEISDKEAETKIFKIIGKKILSGKKVQLNLMHGKNILFNKKTNIGDSIIFNFKTNKIEKIISIEKGKKVFVIKGKHIGCKGKIKELVERGGKKIAKIDANSEKINVWIKNIIVIE